MRQTDAWFQPDALAPLYRTYLAILVVASLGLPTAIIALVEDAPWFVPAGFGATLLVVLGFSWWWAGAYARTVGYRFTDDAIESRGGVWWRSESTVPFSRITNVEAKQGPLARYFGVGTVAVQTAGQGAESSAELSMRGLTDYEALRDQLLESVRAQAGSAASDGAEIDSEAEALDALLSEVRAIRESLE